MAAQSPPPPTPVPPTGSPSPFPTALETPSPSVEPPELSAEAAALVDLDTGQVLFQQRGKERRPIASTTKIMTALLVLEAVPADDVATITSNAASQGGATMDLRPGERITVKELLYGLMLTSANDAAVALAEHIAGTVEAFLERMNERVHQLGLRASRFESPNGLDDRGYSTALDLAAITVEAYRNDTFDEVVATRFARIPAPEGPARRLQNRNALLWLYPDAIGVKTGFTSAAGFCLVGAAERDGLRLGAVVLGAPTEAFSDTAALLEHGFRTFERRTVVEEGQPFGEIRVQGRPVPVRADVELELLLRRGQEVEERVVAEPGLSLPLAAGERVGVVSIRSGDERLASVPLVTARAVASHGEGLPAVRPWWERAWDAVTSFVGGLIRAIFG
ncbi:MAG TPA: D-alanyl-D-alanine carboxypeptidase family protein [Actinomycetota bacterium]|nr:D-alanyl-D-alanine carboxypeptidase family protein [Actinomycetota bacterium]